MNKAVKIVLISLASLVGLAAATGGVGLYLLSDRTTHVKNSETIEPSKAIAESVKRGISKMDTEGNIDVNFNLLTLEKMVNYTLSEKFGESESYNIAGYLVTDFYLEEINEMPYFSAVVKKGPLNTVARSPIYFSFSRTSFDIAYSQYWNVGKINYEIEMNLGINFSFPFGENSVLETLIAKSKYDTYYQNGKFGAKINFSKYLDNEVKNRDYQNYNDSYFWSRVNSSYSSKNHTLTVYAEDMNGMIMNKFYSEIKKSILLENDEYEFKTTDLFFDFGDESFYYGFDLSGLKSYIKFDLESSFTETEMVFTLTSGSINGYSSGPFVQKMIPLANIDEIRIPYLELATGFNSYNIEGGTIVGDSILLSATRK